MVEQEERPSENKFEPTICERQAIFQPQFTNYFGWNPYFAHTIYPFNVPYFQSLPYDVHIQQFYRVPTHP